jgi:serine/threonine protein kinase
MNIIKNEIDDYIINRKSNKSIRKLYKKKHPKILQIKDMYIRNTCLHNKIFNVDEKKYISEGSYGVTYLSDFIHADGEYKDGIVKLLVQKNSNLNVLLELKYLIELNRMIPESVVKLELIERCEIIESGGKSDIVNKQENFIIIGMEKGICDLYDYYKKIENDDNEFMRISSLVMEACNSMNFVGYYHGDIKPSNIIIAARNRINVPLIIDFGFTRYMNTSGVLSSFPPVDSILFGLHVLKKLKLTNKENLIFRVNLLINKFYLVMLKLGVSDKFFLLYCNHHLTHYNLINIFNEFKFNIIKYGLPTDLNIVEMNMYVVNRHIDNIERLRIDVPSKINSIDFFKILKNELKLSQPPIPIAPSGADNQCNCIVKKTGSKCKNKVKTIDGYCLVHSNCKQRFSGGDEVPPINRLRYCYNIKKKNGNDIGLKEAKEMCKKNGLDISGNKNKLCDRLRNNNPPLCL